MNCETVRESFSAKYDGRLSSGEEGGMESHLETCADCRVAWRGWRESLQEAERRLKRVPFPGVEVQRIFDAGRGWIAKVGRTAVWGGFVLPVAFTAYFVMEVLYPMLFYSAWNRKPHSLDVVTWVLLYVGLTFGTYILFYAERASREIRSMFVRWGGRGVLFRDTAALRILGGGLLLYGALVASWYSRVLFYGVI